eukprot:185154-Hanusia_phi.AAC.2
MEMLQRQQKEAAQKEREQREILDRCVLLIFHFLALRKRLQVEEGEVEKRQQAEGAEGGQSPESSLRGSEMLLAMQELEKLWTEQAKQDDERFRRVRSDPSMSALPRLTDVQEKEIERLKSQLKMKEVGEHEWLTAVGMTRGKDKEKTQNEELERLRREVAARARADAQGAAEFDKLIAEKHKKLLIPQVELQEDKRRTNVDLPRRRVIQGRPRKCRSSSLVRGP